MGLALNVISGNDGSLKHALRSSSRPGPGRPRSNARARSPVGAGRKMDRGEYHQTVFDPSLQKNLLDHSRPISCIRKNFLIQLCALI